MKEVSDFLIQTHNEENKELALYLMQILDNEPTKNYVNFNEAFFMLASLKEWELAKKCMEIAEIEISIASGCLYEKNHYALITRAVNNSKMQS